MRLFFIWELLQHLLAVFLLIGSKFYKKYKMAYIFTTKMFKGAISLGAIIIINENMLNDYTIKHEYGHSIQSLIFGPLYLIIIGIPSFIRSIIWTTFKLNYESYFNGFPENWANKLGGNSN